MRCSCEDVRPASLACIRWDISGRGLRPDAPALRKYPPRLEWTIIPRASCSIPKSQSYDLNAEPGFILGVGLSYEKCDACDYCTMSAIVWGREMPAGGQCQAPLVLHESRFTQLPGGCLKHLFQMELIAGFQAYRRLGVACVGNLSVCASRVGDVSHKVPDSTILNDATTERYY